MKKIFLLFPLILSIALCAGCGSQKELPFQPENVESVEVYRFIVPAMAEEKVVSDQNEIETVCSRLIPLRKWKSRNTVSGGTTISFRVNLNDGEQYELIYSESETENIEPFEELWNNIFTDALPAAEDELPVLQ